MISIGSLHGLKQKYFQNCHVSNPPPHIENVPNHDTTVSYRTEPWILWTVTPLLSIYTIHLYNTSIYLSIYLSIYTIHLSISIYQSIYYHLSIYLSIYLSNTSTIYPIQYTNNTIYLSIYLSIYPSIIYLSNSCKQVLKLDTYSKSMIGLWPSDCTGGAIPARVIADAKWHIDCALVTRLIPALRRSVPHHWVSSMLKCLYLVIFLLLRAFCHVHTQKSLGSRAAAGRNGD